MQKKHPPSAASTHRDLTCIWARNRQSRRRAWTFQPEVPERAVLNRPRPAHRRARFIQAMAAGVTDRLWEISDNVKAEGSGGSEFSRPTICGLSEPPQTKRSGMNRSLPRSQSMAADLKIRLPCC
jgi:hypothetical protein